MMWAVMHFVAGDADIRLDTHFARWWDFN